MSARVGGMLAHRGFKTLSAVDAIEIVCSDCGRTKLWTTEHFEGRALPGSATIDELGRRLVCSECRSQGGRGYNVEIRQISM